MNDRKLTYTIGERIAEVLCGILTTAVCAFYIFLISNKPRPMNDIAFLVSTIAGYIVLTALSVRPDLVFKPHKLRSKRRMFIFIKTLLITAAAVIKEILMVTVELNVFLWWRF